MMALGLWGIAYCLIVILVTLCAEGHVGKTYINFAAFSGMFGLVGGVILMVMGGVLFLAERGL